MSKLIVMGIKVTSKENLEDAVAEPLALALQSKIEASIKQIVFDYGENGSGHKLEAIFT